MKEIFKITLSLIMAMTVFASVLCLNVSAAGTTISFGSETVTVGEDVTVNITLNPEEGMFGYKFVVNYDSNVLEYKSGNATGGAGTLMVVDSPSGETSISVSLVFNAKAAGTSAISVVDCVYGALGESGAGDKVLEGASANLTVKDITLSDNANLKSLRPLAGVMTPAFSPDVTEYTVSVENDVTVCKVSAVTAEPNATFDVEGSADLKIGENVRTVIVTAPNGTQKSYKLTIIRSAEEIKPVESKGESTASKVTSSTVSSATSSMGSNTSSDTSSTDDEKNPLEVEISGKKYLIIDDLSDIKLFKGFSAVEGVYGESNVQVAADINNTYRLYYLKAEDSETAEPYTYNKDTNIFKKLEYLVQGEYAYIFAPIPTDFTTPVTYYGTNVTIDGINLKCYANSDSAYTDFYYVYCFVDGKYGFYRYDSVEKVIQRAPELRLVGAGSSDEEAEKEGFLSRFASLTTNAKIIVLGLVALIIGAIALAVVLIVKFARKGNEYDPYEDDYDEEEVLFDQVIVEDTTISDDVIEGEKIIEIVEESDGIEIEEADEQNTEADENEEEEIEEIEEESEAETVFAEDEF